MNMYILHAYIHVYINTYTVLHVNATGLSQPLKINQSQ